MGARAKKKILQNVAKFSVNANLDILAQAMKISIGQSTVAGNKKRKQYTGLKRRKQRKKWRFEWTRNKKYVSVFVGNVGENYGEIISQNVNTMAIQ
jgi:hypothetical protein